jgi:hypothetical protein
VTENSFSLSDLVQIVDEIRSEHFSRLAEDEGRRKAFFLVAIKYLLFSYDLSDEEIIEEIENDHSDQGIDYFFVSSEERPRVFVVQVKHHQEFPKSKQKEAVTKMRTEVDFLLSRHNSRGLTERQRDRFSELKAVRDEDPQINYILLLTGGAPTTLRSEDFGDGQFESDNCVLQVVDQNGLLQLLERADRPRSVTTVMTLDKKMFVPVAERGAYSWCYGLVTIEHYVNATKSHGDDLFALNPRLFLSSSAGPNKAMLKTLEDPSEQRLFHFYNNGITAVCEKMTPKSQNSETVEVELRGLRVVNGCQTTETLWKWASQNPDAAKKTKIMIRIIESQDDDDLNRKISQFTNSQSAILASDLIANDLIQKRMKSALQDDGERPYLYENRRGEWNKTARHKRLSYVIPPSEWSINAGKQYRKIGLREMSQVLQAVCGLPEQAKEGVATLFKPGNARYPKIFRDSWVTPSQVLLAADLYRFISKKENWIPANAREDEREMAGLGRFYICHLIYETWRSDGRPDFSANREEVQLIDPEKSQSIRENFKAEVSNLPWLATLSLIRTFKDPRYSIDGKRALLRKSENRSRIQDEYERMISIRLDSPRIP